MSTNAGERQQKQPEPHHRQVPDVEHDPHHAPSCASRADATIIEFGDHDKTL